MKILLLGDSLFARYEGQNEPHIQHSLKQLLPNMAVDNLAESGDNSYDLLRKMEKEDLAGRDAVFIWIGANDLATHKQVYLGEFQANIRKAATLLQEHYASHQIIFLGMCPVDETKQRYRTNRLAGYYSDVVEEIAAELGCGYLSIRKVFEQSKWPLSEILTGSMDDGLHFGEKGYGLVAQALSDYIKTRLSS